MLRFIPRWLVVISFSVLCASISLTLPPWTVATYPEQIASFEGNRLQFCSRGARFRVFLKELRPPKFLQLVCGSFLARSGVGDQRLFQLCIMTRQKPTAFRSSTATAQALGKFDLSFCVHAKIKTRLRIPRHFRRIRCFLGGNCSSKYLGELTGDRFGRSQKYARRTRARARPGGHSSPIVRAARQCRCSNYLSAHEGALAFPKTTPQEALATG